MIGPNTGLVKRIYELLQEYGPMTRIEIERMIGVDKYNTSIAVGRLRKPLKRKPKRIYILEYVYDAEGGRRYPRPRYAVGDLPNAPKPKPDKTEIRRRYEQSRLTKFRNNNVFNLGKSRDTIREELKAA
jgi:hypothetical protein